MADQARENLRTPASGERPDKSVTRKAGATAALGLVARTLSQLMSLVLLLLAGRYLTVEAFGLFALAVIVLNFGQTILYTGVYAYILKQPGVEDRLPTAMTLQWLISAGFALLIVAVGLVLWAVAGREELGLLILATAPLPIIGLIGCWQESIVLREGRVQSYYLCLILSEASAFAVGIACLIAGVGVWSLIISRYVAGVLFSISLTMLAGPLPRPGFNRDHALEMIRYSRGLYGSNALMFFTQYWSDIIIGIVLPIRAVGLFRMGARTATAAYDVFAQTSRVLGWQVVGRLSRAGRLSEPVWVHMYAVVFMVMLAALGSMAVLAEDLTQTVLGEDWLPMVPVLQIICAVRILASFDLVASAQLSAAGHTGFLFKLRVVEALILAAALAVAVFYGPIAVAAGMLPSTLVLFTVLMWRTAKSTATPISHVVAELVPATIIALGAIVPAAGVAWYAGLEPVWLEFATAVAAGLAGFAVMLVVFRRWVMGTMRFLSGHMIKTREEGQDPGAIA